MPGKTLDCRAAAALCLSSVADGASLSQQRLLFEPRVAARDRGLFRQLCYGTLRLYPRLEGCLSALMDKPLRNKDRDVHMLLLLGLYQLEELRIPDHAAVSATVAASRDLRKPWSKKLINGVLRNWQRNRDQIWQQLDEAERAAHPRWLHRALQTAWPEMTATIEEANNSHPPMCLRVNRQRLSRDTYLKQLSDHSIEADPCEFAIDGVRLKQAVDVEALPGFEQGEVSVQDEAAQLSATLLDLKPGQRLLDACSAPGGKAGHCLEACPTLQEVVALDIDAQRLLQVQQNLDRLQLSATLVAADAANVDAWWDGRVFDRILLDAPCSATGVIRRNPDIKLHRRAADIQPLSQRQLALLNALWTTLADGGLLLYATCSVLPEENEQVVAAFINQCNNSGTPVEHRIIEADWGVARPCGRQLFPSVHGHDGFFYALLCKPPA